MPRPMPIPSDATFCLSSSAASSSSSRTSALACSATCFAASPRPPWSLRSVTWVGMASPVDRSSRATMPAASATPAITERVRPAAARLLRLRTLAELRARRRGGDRAGAGGWLVGASPARARPDQARLELAQERGVVRQLSRELRLHAALGRHRVASGCSLSARPRRVCCRPAVISWPAAPRRSQTPDAGRGRGVRRSSPRERGQRRARSRSSLRSIAGRSLSPRSPRSKRCESLCCAYATTASAREGGTAPLDREPRVPARRRDADGARRRARATPAASSRRRRSRGTSASSASRRPHDPLGRPRYTPPAARARLPIRTRRFAAVLDQFGRQATVGARTSS